jgi:hypothetical protein
MNLWKIIQNSLTTNRLRALLARKQSHHHSGDVTLPDKAARNRIARLVEGLGYDFARYTLEHFIDFLSEQRPRPLQVIHFPSQIREPLGMWCSTPHRDYVVIPFGEHIHPLLQEHIGLHEVAHILLGHPPVALDQLEGFEGLGQPGTPVGRARKFTRSHLLSDRYEIEAEYMATMIQQQIIQAKGQPNRLRYLSSIDGMNTLVDYLAFHDRKRK